MWRGLLEGESSLPAGTPWPVKGYKELICTIAQSGKDAPGIDTILFSDVDAPVFTRSGVGAYSLDGYSGHEVLINGELPSIIQQAYSASEDDIIFIVNSSQGAFITQDSTKAAADELLADITLSFKIYSPL